MTQRGQPGTFRVRWDRVAVLVLVLASLLVLGVRAATGGPDAAAHAIVPAAAVRTVPQGSGGCRATPATVRHAPPLPGRPDARTVALTFDDGPGPATPAVLALLREARARATFFVVGREAAADPATVRAVALDGHLIGNHTWAHRPPARTWDPAILRRELDRTATAIEAATGAPSCWFRPPEGVMGGSERVTRPRGLATGLWSVDTLDWKVQRDPGGVAEHAAAIRRAAAAGLAQEHPVLIFHDGPAHREATLAALPGVLEDYRRAGYAFVRLDGR